MAMSGEKTSVFAHVRGWYGKFERPISSLSLVGGFVFDALTLKRVDLFWENFWVVVHLLVVAISIFLINLIENEGSDEKDPAKVHFWLVNILQFFFGGLLSTFLVFYFRSGSLAASWPFFLVLAAAFAANESLKRHYTRLSFQISLLFLSVFSFAIFLLPVIFHKIGLGMFLASGGVSLGAILLFLLMLRGFAKEKFAGSGRMLALSIGGVLMTFNILYFLNLIPPIPLSLKDGAMLHSVARNPDGSYAVQYEDQGPFSFFHLSEDVHLAPGSQLIAYSAIFSPPDLDVTIVHEWQHYDPRAGGWTTASRIALPVTGGRDGGYRTYSLKTDLAPGAWRVNVETEQGSLIGRLRFNVISAETPVPLETGVK